MRRVRSLFLLWLPGVGIFWAVEHLLAAAQGEWLLRDFPPSVAGFLFYLALGAVWAGIFVLVASLAPRRFIGLFKGEGPADAWSASGFLIGLVLYGVYWLDKVFSESFYDKQYLAYRQVILIGVAFSLAGLFVLLFRWFRRIPDRERREVWFLASALGATLLLLGGRRLNESGLTGQIMDARHFVSNAAILAGGAAAVWAGGLLLRRLRAPIRRASVAVLTALPLVWLGFNAAKSPGPSFVEPAEEKRPDILLIVMDTARADHLSLAGYRRKTTPFLDQLAQMGVTFLRAYSAGPVTPDSHGAIFTGQSAARHGFHYPNYYLSDRFETLASILKNRGYRTAGYSNNDFIKAGTGLERGFEKFDLVQHDDWVFVRQPFFYRELDMRLGTWERVLDDKGASLTNQRAARWLAQVADDPSPFFLFINYMEAHAPYTPPASARTLFAEEEPDDNPAVLGYDRNLAYLDGRIRELLALPEFQRRKRDLLIIVTADHGEHFGEHGITGHDNSLFDAELRVPLIVVYPGLLPAGARVRTPVQVTDILPSVLDILGLSDLRRSIDFQGRSWMPLLNGAKDAERRIAFEHYSPGGVYRGWTDGQWKYVEPGHGRPAFLFDLEKDPQESVNLRSVTSLGRPYMAIAQKMAEDLKRWVNSSGNFSTKQRDGEGPGLDAKTRQRLRALGYIVD